jgi:CheY-like chemotaxis protein
MLNYELTESDISKYAEISIEDNGAGISESHIPKIYDPFFTTKEEGKGTGLGLSTVYGIVKQSGGCIRVNSKVNEGTKFSIILPIVGNNNNEVENIKDIDKESEQSPGQVQRKNTILVVDDNQSILTILSRTLLMRKLNVIATANPVEGLQILRDNADTIDLVISDIVMPELSGIDLIERFITSKPDIKVIFITAYIQDPVIQKRVESLNFPILTKPFDFEKLVELVIETLDK